MGKERRALTPGRSLCRPCGGSGRMTPGGGSERVCGKCFGKGYVVSRDASTGSWFEDIPRKVMAHSDPGGEMTQDEIRAKVQRRRRFGGVLAQGVVPKRGGVLDEW
jgi:hypothetical protein